MSAKPSLQGLALHRVDRVTPRYDADGVAPMAATLKPIKFSKHYSAPRAAGEFDTLPRRCFQIDIDSGQCSRDLGDGITNGRRSGQNIDGGSSNSSFDRRAAIIIEFCHRLTRPISNRACTKVR